jgi:condensin complex subunit 2
MVQLDSALQVDPLFHKMSKAFDEGGAKGLLLANLGVSTTGAEGCQIVFDSSCNEDDDTNNNNNSNKDEQVDDDDENGLMVDMEWFTQTLPSIASLPPLVPQLQALRAEYELLKSQGFVEDDDDNNKGRAAGRTSMSGGGANGRRRSKVLSS